jgi:hypothetical protein
MARGNAFLHTQAHPIKHLDQAEIHCKVAGLGSAAMATSSGAG